MRMRGPRQERPLRPVGMPGPELGSVPAASPTPYLLSGARAGWVGGHTLCTSRVMVVHLMDVEADLCVF